MVAPTLVGLPIGDGARLVAALDAADVPIRSAFWIYSSEWGEWRLALASPIVDQRGPREMYRRVQDVLGRHPDISLRLDQLWAVGPNHPVVTAVRKLMHLGPGVGGARLANVVFNGQFIEDAYVYRSM